MKIKNEVFSLNVSDSGYLRSLRLINDPYRMNWVLSKRYLERVGYLPEKLFGDFDFMINESSYSSRDIKPGIRQHDSAYTLTYIFDQITVSQVFDLNNSSGLTWRIEIKNTSQEDIYIADFGVWASFAYVMFRDKNVQKNIFNSAAVFPSISKDYTKVAVMRRSTREPSVGLFQTKGETLSVGTYCQFENRFFEDVSPSLDGLLSHRLVFSGGYPNGGGEDDWIYPKKKISLGANVSHIWEFQLVPVKSQADFYQQSQIFGHPRIQYDYQVPTGQLLKFRVQARQPVVAAVDHFKIGEQLSEATFHYQFMEEKQEWLITGNAIEPGEHVLRVHFADGTEDQVIYNVCEELTDLIEERVDYICDHLFTDEAPYIFKPESNQGESLGKLSLVVKKNLLTRPNKDQLLKVEKSVNHYIINKWFEQGDFSKPKNLYGDFYRVMDFEYLGHLLYLLSTVPSTHLSLQAPETYLKWAAEVVELRINPTKHTNIRAQEEAGMLGVFFLYINDLIKDLQQSLPETGERVDKLWRNNLLNVAEDSGSYRSAMTEHFFDNAGFGPAAGALAQAGFSKAASDYADLVLANIGFSNDFRAQNPDRWWEALTYMIHSLWGGVTAAAAYDSALFLQSAELMEASYRATIAVLYCYDHHAKATKQLGSGEAASTYAVCGPHVNRPDLSRQRFGQEEFAQDGGIFAKLFDQAASSSDWDMGEELVAYLDRFGQRAFCYYDESGELRGINCLIQIQENMYQIMSLAPYPKEIFLLTEDGWQLIDDRIKRS